MTERRFQEFVEGFLRQRSLPVSQTLQRLQQAEDYITVCEQCRIGASERVLAMLLERALRQ